MPFQGAALTLITVLWFDHKLTTGLYLVMDVLYGLHNGLVCGIPGS